MPTETKYSDFKLRPQQAQAFSLIQNFINEENSKVFILSGFAGTGKTTLVSSLINWFKDEDIKYSLLATTGRAAKVLSDKTKVTANTIHSHIYVFNDISDDLEKVSSFQDKLHVDDSGQLSLLFGLRSIASSDEKIYIVDEASMISDCPDQSASFAQFGTGDLLNDILNFDPKGKFIFIGDTCQLPPINQKNSPALSSESINAKYNCVVKSFELTEVIRHEKTSGVLEASYKIRKLKELNPNVKFANLPVRGHKNIQLHTSHINLLNFYIQDIKENGFEQSTMICQTNKHCSDINSIIRKALYNTEERLVPGDLLMVTQNNYVSSLVNGDQVIIKQIGSREYRCGLSFLNVEVEELLSKKVFTLLMVEDILFSTGTNLSNKQHKDLMIDYYKRMQGKGIKQKDKKFKDNMLTDPYLNALKAVYGYAITCHKSQGGEWNEVFLYLDNKIHGIPKPNIYQWWYTAVTRAKENLHLVDDWYIK